MKLSGAILTLFVSGAIAAPAPTTTKRQDDVSAVDSLMFGISLPSFVTRHQNEDPPHFDWTTDGCTKSPNNPFGFPFEPACWRHDFGYQNFRIQSRFTESNKLRIDDRFKEDLNTQCDGVSTGQGPCRALADVYYAAVRAFGGGDATAGRVQTVSVAESSADKEATEFYNEKVEAYQKAVKEAQEKGELPELDE